MWHQQRLLTLYEVIGQPQEAVSSRRSPLAQLPLRPHRSICPIFRSPRPTYRLPRRNRPLPAHLPLPGCPHRLPHRLGAISAAQGHTLLRRVFAIQVLTCDRCGGKRRLMALIDKDAAMQKTLGHLDPPTQPPAAWPARALPSTADGGDWLAQDGIDPSTGDR